MSITNDSSGVNCGSAFASPVFSDGVFIDTAVLAGFFHVDYEAFNQQLLGFPSSIKGDLVRVDNGGNAVSVHRDLVPRLEVFEERGGVA